MSPASVLKIEVVHHRCVDVDPGSGDRGAYRRRLQLIVACRGHRSYRLRQGASAFAHRHARTARRKLRCRSLRRQLSRRYRRHHRFHPGHRGRPPRLPRRYPRYRRAPAPQAPNQPHPADQLLTVNAGSLPLGTQLECPPTIRPTESPTLFLQQLILQQLSRGLRRSRGKNFCTVLDFVGTHRRLLQASTPADVSALSERERRLVRMLVVSVGDQVLTKEQSLQDAVNLLWSHPQVRGELA
jgi:hypothetical protein